MLRGNSTFPIHSGLVLAALLAGLGSVAQGQPPSPTPELAGVLNCEGMEAPNGYPRGWLGTNETGAFLDNETVHGGSQAIRLERGPDGPGRSSMVMTVVSRDFLGSVITVRGFLKLDQVEGAAGFFIRQFDNVGAVGFVSMQPRGIDGTRDWMEYLLNAQVNEESIAMDFGLLFTGSGTVWMDDLEVLVDGKPIWDAPKREPTVFDRDHEFDRGSGVSISGLSEVQVDNLALLGKVWGFEKYHHPAVAAGKIHFDYELFRVLPAVLAAETREAGRAAIEEWVAGLGDPVAAEAPAREEEESPGELHLGVPSGWIRDETLLRPELSKRLTATYQNRFPGDAQFYVGPRPNGNPEFRNEHTYRNVRLPDAGYQLLGLYRFWNIIEYWSPNRNLIDAEDTADRDAWDAVLREFVPRMMQAGDSDAYTGELVQLFARIQDTHSDVMYVNAQPPTGICEVPVSARVLEAESADPLAVIYKLPGTGSAPVEGLAIGDVITAVDGTPTREIFEKAAPYYSASNLPELRHRIVHWLTRGDCGPATLTIRNERGEREVAVERVPINFGVASQRITHDRPGEALQMLSPDVAYLKLSSIVAEQIPAYLETAADTRGLVIDIRNYPAEFVPFALGSHLVDQRTPFASFTHMDYHNPGASHFGVTISQQPSGVRYPGRVAILVDETSISQSEYTAMALRVSPGALVIGSTTAGADGNVSEVILPGNIRTNISGLGVFYPDHTPTQRVGIVPDVEVHPTVEGIRAGRDEVLEEAMRQILGPEVSEAKIQEISGP